jgi:hypothetical protein
MAARTSDEDAIALQHLHRHLVDAPVGQRAFLEILLALDEGGRIEDHHVPVPALGARRLEEIEGIGLDRIEIPDPTRCSAAALRAPLRSPASMHPRK